ncbi:MAG TPA: GXGXG motif-containing protein, partial [Aestuariivirgaceae bacterium]|nr:GXGXG motif-containing protein [Aestuariivirgaceae bacterium]
MAGVKAVSKEHVSPDHVSHELGMHTEALRGRTQQRFFDVSDAAVGGFAYPDAPDVDFNKRAEFDAAALSPRDVNLHIRDLIKRGFGTIVVKNPGAKHSLGVGILNRLNLIFEGSLGYFGCGLI